MSRRPQPMNVSRVQQDGSETDTESPTSTSSIDTRISASDSRDPRNGTSPLQSPSPTMSDSPSPRRSQNDFEFDEDLPPSVVGEKLDTYPGVHFAPVGNMLLPCTLNMSDDPPVLGEVTDYGGIGNKFTPSYFIPERPSVSTLPVSPKHAAFTEEELQNHFADNCYIYRVPNYPHHVSMRTQKLTGEPFMLAGFRWQILFFPVGNRYQPDKQTVSMFVQLLDPHTYPSNIQHKFKFTILPPPGSHLLPIMRDSHHRFTQVENDRGFSDYALVESVLRYVHPPNHTLVIKVEMTKEPYKYSTTTWPDSNYDSKAVTGFVGLKNQGATCYMNSLLQTLFHLPPFRQLIYSLPTDDDQASRVPLSLQRVFYNLQTSRHAPSTKQLTAAFGWNSLEAFMQHDVQEFSRVLLDNLDERLKKTPLDGKVEEMFAGKVEMFIECVNVPYKSQRTETYFDLALNVKGCPTLAKSFEQYCEVEMLDGDNKYRAEQHGLQDARKGVRFLSFPPVLQLQLKRFEYNFERDMNVKLNDRFEFPLSIDLSPYLSSTVQPAPPSDPHIYHLHSVLVHSGSGHGGHYYSFIKPFFSKLPYSKSPWFKFDDEHVTTATEEEATVGNYGGETRAGYYPITRLSMANAYMLVYIRQRVTQEITQIVPEKLDEMKEGAMTNGEVHHDSIDNPVVRSEGEVSAPVKAELDAAFLAQNPEAHEAFLESKDAGEDATMPELSPPSDSENAEDEKMPPLVDDRESPEYLKPKDEDIDALSLTPIDVPLPESLLQQFQRAEELQREKRERAAREHLYTDLLLLSDQHLVNQSLNGLGAGWELHVLQAPAQPEGEQLDIGDSQIQAVVPSTKVRALRTDTIAQAAAVRSKPKAEGAEGDYEWDELLAIPHDRQQFYTVTESRKAPVSRPSMLLPATSHMCVDQMRDGVFVRDCAIDCDPEIAALTGNAGAGLAPEYFNRDAENGRSLILCKVFDVVQQRVVYLGSLVVHNSMPFASLEPLFRTLMSKRGFTLSSLPNDVLQEANALRDADAMQLEPDSRLKFSDERHGVASSAFDVEDLDPDAPTVGKAGLRTGDIIVAQLDVTDGTILALADWWKKQGAVSAAFQPTYPAYLEYVQCRLLVELRVLAGQVNSKIATTKRVELIETMNVEQIVAHVADVLSLDPSRVVLHKAHPVHAGHPEDRAITESWQYKSMSRTFTLSGFVDRTEPVLYVVVLEYSASQLRDYMPIRMLYIEKDGRSHSVKTLVPRAGCVRDAVIAARQWLLENQVVSEFATSANDVCVFMEATPPRQYIEGMLDDPIEELISFRSVPFSKLGPEVLMQEMFEGLAAAKRVDDQILSDDTVDGSTPVLHMVWHYCHMSATTLYRPYSHMFPIVVPQNADATTIMNVIFERLHIDDPERRSQCKLAWLYDGRGREIDLNSNDEVFNFAHPTFGRRLGFHDPVHFRDHQAAFRAQVAENNKAAAPFASLSRFNNAPIKFYQ